jgi:hypothetical protein
VSCAVDFDPSAGANKFPTQYVSKKVVLAMFYHQMLAKIDRNEGSLQSGILHFKKVIGLNNNQHKRLVLYSG